MSNKLKKIFSNDIPDLTGKIQFKTRKDLENFVKIIHNLPEGGKAVEVKGIKRITTHYNEYPLFNLDELDSIVISSPEQVVYDIETESGQKSISFIKHSENSKVILQTRKNDVFYIKLEFVEETEKVTFTYKFQPEHANSMKEIVEDCAVLETFLHTMFYEADTERDEQVEQFKESISEIKRYFKMICDIEHEINTSFAPDKFGKLEKEEGRIEELYLLLVEKEAIRLNVKLADAESAKIELERGQMLAEPEVGKKLDLTFRGQDEYIICGQQIVVYKVCLISNIIVKEIKRENEIMIVYYDDSDSEPMFISYTGFISEEAAKKELDNVMNHLEKYTKANTLSEYCGKYYK